VHCYQCDNVWRPKRSAPRKCPLCSSRDWNQLPVLAIRPFDRDNKSWQRLIAPNRKEILRLARKFHARSVSVFGSFRNGTAHRFSDVDFLVTFEGDPDFFRRHRLSNQLSELLRRRVDVICADNAYWPLEARVRSDAVLV
jgi:predicted nucleotidyltransferase